MPDEPRLRRMQKAAVGALGLALLLTPILAGCSGPGGPGRAVMPADVGYDPSAVHVEGVRRLVYNVTSADGILLAATAYVPLTNDTLPGGAMPAWPLVVFLHGWGGARTGYEAYQELFALSGMASVAYDARGFGESGGVAMVASKAEESDLAAVIHDAKARLNTARVGVVGQSYGGGQALLALAHNDDVEAVVAQYGWTDLADGLVPGNVPKLAWVQTLYGYGLVGSKTKYDPVIHDWYQQAFTRDNIQSVRKQLQDRSVGTGLSQVAKPLLLCQGMQETLFPQADRAWSTNGGFTRSYIYQGGHGGNDPACWSKALDWLLFFLAGRDTHVDDWPALETVDAAGNARTYTYGNIPQATIATYHPRGAELAANPSAASFTIRQAVAGNPLSDPAALWDRSGLPNQFLPDDLRIDPSAVSFSTGLEAARTLFGAPIVTLHHVDGDAPFQVVGTLLRERPDGQSQILSHAAVAALSEADVADGNLTMQFHWTHARFDAGDKLVLRIASNDLSWYMPLLEDYEVTFDGSSALSVPWT